MFLKTLNGNSLIKKYCYYSKVKKFSETLKPDKGSPIYLVSEIKKEYNNFRMTVFSQQNTDNSRGMKGKYSKKVNNQEYEYSIGNFGKNNYKISSPEASQETSKENKLNEYELYIQNILSKKSKYKTIFLNILQYCPKENYLPLICKNVNGRYVYDLNKWIYLDFSNLSLLGHSFFAFQPDYNTDYSLFYNESKVKTIRSIKEFFQFKEVVLCSNIEESLNRALFICEKLKPPSKLNTKILISKGCNCGRELIDSTELDFSNCKEVESEIQKGNIFAVVIQPVVFQKEAIFLENISEIIKLCQSKEIFVIIDESLTGMGRYCSKKTYSEFFNLNPDFIILDSSVSNEQISCSLLLTNHKVGLNYGELNMNQNCFTIIDKCIEFFNTNLGLLYHSEAREGIFACYMKVNNKFVKSIKGRGVLYSIEFKEDCPFTAYQFCLKLYEMGLLCYAINDHLIRITPTLNINESELYRACEIIKGCLSKFESLFDNYRNEQEIIYDFREINETAKDLVQMRFEKNEALGD